MGANPEVPMPQSETLPFPPGPWPWLWDGRPTIDGLERDRLICGRCGARRLVVVGHRPTSCGFCTLPADALHGATLGPAIDGQEVVYPVDATPCLVEVGCG